MRACAIATQSAFAALLFLAPCWGASEAFAHEAGDWEENARHVIPARPRPADAERVHCDVEGGVCIHARRGTDPTLVGRAAASGQRALRALAALGMPPPPSDGGRGGSFDLDVYLDRRARGGAAYTDPQTPLGFDRLSSYLVVATSGHGPSCGFEQAVTRAVVQSVIFGLDAAEHDGTVAMLSSYLAALISPCAVLELDAVDRFQRAPELAISQADRRWISGTLLFPSYLDARWGTGGVGAVMTGLVATSSQRTPAEAERFDNEPDIYDALRKVLPPLGAQLGQAMIDFAVARAFVGDRSDGAHLVDTERFGALGRARFEWSLDYPSLPRRVAPRRPVAAMGATYVWLDLAGADPHAALQFIAEWESASVFHWAVVRVDADGRELGRSNIGGVFGNDRAELTVSDIDGAAALLIVGLNLGDDDREHPFDPDVGTPSEAGYTITLHRM